MIDCVYCNKPFKNEKKMSDHLLICNIENKKGVYALKKDEDNNQIKIIDDDDNSDSDTSIVSENISDIIMNKRIEKTDPEVWNKMMKKIRQSRLDEKDEALKKTIDIESRKCIECKFCHKKFTRTFNLNRHILTSCSDKLGKRKIVKDNELNHIDKDNLLEIRKLKQQIKILQEDDITKNKIIENLLFYTDKIDTHIEPNIENNNLILSKISSSLFYSSIIEKRKEELFKTKWNKYIKNQIKTERKHLDDMTQLDLCNKYNKAFQQFILSINRLKNLNKMFAS